MKNVSTVAILMTGILKRLINDICAAGDLICEAEKQRTGMRSHVKHNSPGAHQPE